ncbi:Endonuclease YncB, thermonuclease family [Cruoricaptor ignavus]|uniref:Endonuclease YncB, thermonuclease family n=1 Tax=Cruoricaptor ignavus TaxID=1118202 RepID=A0A1M6D110_9FLAO|nr:thermonuclease family protein [Cruoricaptor ignavus]SHI66803.1 Endonuclease YncB, thermonuclease family [Cruoricaptor ignavus]
MRIAFLVIFFFPLSIFSQIKAKIVGVKDGDTVVALLEGNQQMTLRLADVDCPEKGQAYGTQARKFTSDQVFGKNVVFYIETTDRYGRAVARIYDGSRYLSEEIIRAGYGWWYERYSKNIYLKTVEAEARRAKRGLWADPHAVPPWDYRRMQRGKKAA